MPDRGDQEEARPSVTGGLNLGSLGSMEGGRQEREPVRAMFEEESARLVAEQKGRAWGSHSQRATVLTPDATGVSFGPHSCPVLLPPSPTPSVNS